MSRSRVKQRPAWCKEPLRRHSLPAGASASVPSACHLVTLILSSAGRHLTALPAEYRRGTPPSTTPLPYVSVNAIHDVALHDDINSSVFFSFSHLQAQTPSSLLFFLFSAGGELRMWGLPCCRRCSQLRRFGLRRSKRCMQHARAGFFHFRCLLPLLAFSPFSVP